MPTDASKNPTQGTEGDAPKATAKAKVAGKGNSVPVHLRPRPLRLRLHGWLRWLHIYISMFSLLAILFFSLTGITLNHPDWAVNKSQPSKTIKGQLPEGWKAGGKVDWLKVVEYLRAHDNVRGPASAMSVDDSEGSVSFKAPGYSADCFFDPQKGTYELTATSQGFVGMMNDFHRGSETKQSWKRVIDFSGIFLTIVALTGLCLLWYLKKVRVAALMAMAVGCVLVWVLMKLSM